MKFEGEHKIIPVRGIARAGADTLCDDGAMNEVIGLEYKDGSYVPYNGNVDNNKKLPYGIRLFRVHKTTKGNNIIAYIETAPHEFILSWMSEEKFNRKEGENLGSWNTIRNGELVDIEISNNIVIVLGREGKNEYFLFNGEYSKITVDNIREQLPYANLYVTNDEGLKINNKNNGPVLCVINRENTSLGEEGVNGTYLKGISKLNELGRLHGYVLATYAYKLVSGEYIYASAPVLLCPPNHAVGKVSEYEDKYDNTLYYTTQYYETRGDYNLLTLTPTDEIEKDFEYGEYATSDSVARIFKGNQNQTAVYEGSTSAINNLPPLYANICISHAFSGYRRIMMSFASNAMKCRISNDIDQSLKDLVSSLCIFISDQVPQYEINASSMHQTSDIYPVNSSNEQLTAYKLHGFYFDKRSDEDIIEDIQNLRGFYLAHEIPFNEIQKGDVTVDLSGKLGDNVFLQTTLPISAFTNKETLGGNIFVYNGRNHVYNYLDKSIYGFMVKQSMLIGGNGQLSRTSEDLMSVQVKAVIRSIEHGEYTVVSDIEEVPANLFNGYLTYPNSSVSELHINYNGGVIIQKMTPAKSGGYSYALFSLDYINPVHDSGIQKDFEPSEFPLFSQPNKMKVSDVTFVYTFPNTNTYTIGKGSIIGLASLSIALSQDNFGQYPLLVFCTDGVYSMNVDTSGNGVYTNVPPPFSHEVCINRNTICEIDGAVLFASSKGLMVATSQGVQEFLPTMNGKPKHLPQIDMYEKGLGLVWYRDIISSNTSTQLEDYVSQDDFIEFLSDSDTVVSYASEKNKVIVYNKSRNYSYWIDIPTRNVTKLPIGIKLDNNNYPTEDYLTNEDTIITLPYMSAKGNVQCMLQTRPIKIVNTLKSTLRVVTRGYFVSDSSDKYACMLVLGSLDAINWQPLGKQFKQFNGGFNDLGCVVDRVSCKYLMVIVTGDMNSNSHIDGIELTEYSKYNNKLK